MAKKQVVSVVCDRCGYEDMDTKKFLHVTVTPVPVYEANGKIKMAKANSSRDLCNSCVGMPSVNLEA